MTKQTVPDFKELFKQAAEIAKHVPENMQEAAFNRALDMLTANTLGGTTNQTASSKASKSPSAKQNAGGEEFKLKELLASIDSTQHPAVILASKVLDQALMILRIALTEHNVDGLTPSQIAQILKDKFRLKTSANAVNKALGRNTDLVNRIAAGKAYLYKIMAPGEKYLAALGEKQEPSSAGVKSTKPSKKKKERQKANNDLKNQPKTVKSKSGRPGPGEMIRKLTGEGFFKKNKTIQDITDYCQSSFAYAYKGKDISVALIRALRNNDLRRQKNADKQFEYFE